MNEKLDRQNCVKEPVFLPQHLPSSERIQEVNLSVLLKIAEVMNCNAGDMMDFLPDEAITEVSIDDE